MQSIDIYSDMIGSKQTLIRSLSEHLWKVLAPEECMRQHGKVVKGGVIKV